MNVAATQTQETDYAPEETRAANEERLRDIVGGLEKLAQEQVAKKADIEKRWLSDLEQFHGHYDAETIAKLKDSRRSRLFVNLTRSKTNAWEARLSDMLFPTDDKNWGIKPTPNPDMARKAKGPDDAAANEAEAFQKEAKERSDAMEREIEDQLVEGRYNVKCRDSIHDACVLGTGIMKGPMAATKTKRQWEKIASVEGAAAMYQLNNVKDPSADFERTDPWNYFPDMNGRSKADCEFEFERHLLNKKQMRKLAKQPGFKKDAIRRVLQGGAPKEPLPNFVSQIQSITENGSATLEARYHVWEYHGELDGEDLRLVCECLGEHELAEEIDDDPLKSIQVIVWFCEGEIFKFGVHPLDSQESLYSVFNLEGDDSSLFGYGVPYLMRDSQKSLNSAWRMMMDNSGLSTGPQIVVNKAILEPADGSWELTPRKIWLATLKNGQSLDHAFKAYAIDGRQEELIQVINLARQFADDETNLPVIAQGEQGSHTTQTANGMSMLMNSVNVVFRRVVKNFDDDMTTPNIRRIYDWNMQFSTNDNIKGDFEVDARGSSVLLVREVQAQNLMVMALQFANHPILGPLTKHAALYRKIVQAHMLPANEIVMTEDEIAQAQKDQEGKEPPPDVELMKLETQKEIARFEGETKMKIAEIERETAMMKLQAAQEIARQQIAGKLQSTQMQTVSGERKMAAEIGVKERHGDGI